MGDEVVVEVGGTVEPIVVAFRRAKETENCRHTNLDEVTDGLTVRLLRWRAFVDIKILEERFLKGDVR